ncbi:DUF3644 domain-containing protein [Mesorhizobium australicum]|uniref:DUF3644 domain-containing protein n=1 Tax=Mesorhizobium australicum TaxID=536018 RepID=UPI0033368836
MAGKGATLTAQERRVVKALLKKGWTNQDVQALVNSGRKATVNFARISGVKQDANQTAATDTEVDFFKLYKRAYDPQTGLNRYDDERLIRAREAMTLAVQIFNSAALKFKAEVFCVLSNIAWTYLLHEYYQQQGVAIVDPAGNSLLLGHMIERQDCPLTDGTRDNLRVIKNLRDKVEHLLMGKADIQWMPLFQACCLNFDKALCDMFGDKLTLSHDLSFALQFARLNINQASMVNQYEIPEHIASLDAHLMEGLTAEQLANIEFQFKVIYTLDVASKSKAHFQFFKPDSAEGKEIHNVLGYLKAADEMYPVKAGKVPNLVREKSGVHFTGNDHIKAWRHYKVRPKTKAAVPENTNKDYCIYHTAHGDYTYSQAWVDKLAEDIVDPVKLAAIRAVKVW